MQRANQLFIAGCCVAAYAYSGVPCIAGGNGDQCAWVLAAQQLGPRVFDDKQGRDTNNYPPDRTVDVTHIELNLRFDDLRTRSFSGSETYSFRAIAPGIDRFELDAVDLLIEDVKSGKGTPPLEYRYDSRKLYLKFKQPLPSDRVCSVIIRYRCVDPEEGLIFSVPDERLPGRSPQMHSQGQAQSNRYWFACHDAPNERSTSELIVSVPQGLEVISNGKLLGKGPDGTGLTQFRWRQEQPHVAYLVSLIIGQFSEVSDTWRGIPVRYYVAPGLEEDARRAFARTPQMLDFFSERFGVDYPFAQYAQTCVELFHAGGMENTSATTLAPHVPLDERAVLDKDYDGLIAHELGHQWFGDMITCKSWSHIWLNEGFASFCDDLWKEHRLGADDLSYALWNRYRNVAGSDSSEAPDAVIFADYSDPWDVFGHKGSLPYGKGSSILHMLRHELGEDVFWRGFQEYVKRYQFKEVETDDFRRVLEEFSGRSLVQFFEQWTARPGVPRLKVAYRWDPASQSVIVDIEQTQKLDRNTPAFDVPLDLFFRADGQGVTETVQLSKRVETFRKAFTSPPELFCVDPQCGLLKEVKEDKPRPMWIRQLLEGPTVAARCEAASVLSRDDRPEVIEALVECARNLKEFHAVREEAIAALGRLQKPQAGDALLEMLQTGIDHPDVRRRVVEAVGQYRSPKVTEALLKFAESDPTYGVEASATRALASAFDDGFTDRITDRLIKNAAKTSHADQIATAAADAIGQLQRVEGIDALMSVAAYGRPDRTRPAGISALGKFGKEASVRDRVREFLVPMLNDPEYRAQDAAVAALGELGDIKAVEPLTRLRDGGARSGVRTGAQNAISRIYSQLDEGEAVRKLREELDRLESEKESLEKRIESLERRPVASGSAAEDVEPESDDPTPPAAGGE